MTKNFDMWNRTIDIQTRFANLETVDRLMGAGESIHTVSLSWDFAVVSSKNIWCVRRRHRRRAASQAVSSVAPSICQSVSKENAALADGASSTVPHMMLQRAELVSSILTKAIWMSNEAPVVPVENHFTAGEGTRTPRARSDKLDPAPCLRLAPTLS